MSRSWDVFTGHVGIATRTSAGVASGAVACGEYQCGMLVIRIVSLAVGGKVKPYWMSSADGVNFGTLATVATLAATGVYFVSPPAGWGGVGLYAKARWTVGGSTGVKFGLSYVFQT